MQFRILGPLEVRDGERLVHLGGLKQRALLALLLTRAGEVVSRERLIDELWAGDPPATAVSVFQTYLSHLRKALGPDVIRTHPSGYALELAAHDFDLRRFEQLLQRARESQAEAATLLRDALELWRGPALADFTYEAFAQAEIVRLEELRMVALEWRIEADLALGRHDELIGELEALVSKHPLREHLRELLMLALYRAGRQADALEVYQAARTALVGELGIEPSPALQELERAILRHDPLLEIQAPAAERAPAPIGDEAELSPPDRSILVVAGDEDHPAALLELAAALARRPARELILARVISPSGDLSAAIAALNERREALASSRIPARIAAFTSSERGRDIVLLASEQPTDLVLADAPSALVAEGAIDEEVHTILADVPCDVGLLVTRAPADLPAGGAVTVPFSGAEHDWSAIEIAAWISRSLGTSLQLVGTAAAGERRDASRLLARASLLVQHASGVVTEPVLVHPDHGDLIAATEQSGLVILGLSPRWRQEGLGDVRLAVARDARPPTLLVRRGVRPGGLAPRESLTRFTWTLATETP